MERNTDYEIRIAKEMYRAELNGLDILDLFDMFTVIADETEYLPLIETRLRDYILELMSEIVGVTELKSILIESYGEEKYRKKYREIENGLKEASNVKVHGLRCEARYFDDVVSGEKRFEIRKKDRKFEVGDTVILKRIFGEQQIDTGDRIQATISYILDDERYCKDGYVILGLSKIKKLIGTEKESVG